jgi:integrase/recombinase XerD
VKTFAQYLQEKDYAENTISSYTFAIDQLTNRAQSLTNQSLLAHKEWLVSSFAPKTANNRIGAINAYLDFIAFDGIRLKGVRIQQRPFLDNVISNEQYMRMRDELKRDGDWLWYFIVRFLGCTGARVSELRQFRVHHIDTGYMDIVSKGQKLRRIWIPLALRQECAIWKDRSAPNDLLFPGKNNQPITSRGISLGLKRVALRYGIDQDVVYPHSFRHLFAKNFIANNPDIALLADLMGHESIETTRIYLRRTANEQRAAVDATVNW